MKTLKKGELVYVVAIGTPGHERNGYYGSVESIIGKPGERQMIVVASRHAPNGVRSVEHPQHVRTF